MKVLEALEPTTQGPAAPDDAHNPHDVRRERRGMLHHLARIDTAVGEPTEILRLRDPGRAADTNLAELDPAA